MDLKYILPNEASQTETVTYYDSIYMTFWQRQDYREENICECWKLEVEGRFDARREHAGNIFRERSDRIVLYFDYSLVKLIELHIRKSEFYHVYIKNKAKTYLYKNVYYMLVSVFCLCVHVYINMYA